MLGWKAHQRVVFLMNASIMNGFRLAGSRISSDGPQLPSDRPLIIVCNHQSRYDIIGLYWYLRANFPLFVSKKELAKGIPSISYNLRNSGSALIDRADRRQAIAAIGSLGLKANKENRAVIIFPEGTRSKDGQLKDFALGGFGILCKKMPTALVVPVAIKGTGKMDIYNVFLVKAFQRLSWTICEPLEQNDWEVPALLNECRNRIENELNKDELNKV